MAAAIIEAFIFTSKSKGTETYMKKNGELNI